MKKLDLTEWRFDQIPDVELEAAWRWEIEREAGSGTKPWLKLTKQSRQMAVKNAGWFSPSPPVEVQSLDQITEENDANLDNLPLSLHGFRIDWSRGSDAVGRWLMDWARSKPHEKARQQWPHGKNKGGRRMRVDSWLTDLAIYRLSKSGVTNGQGKTLMQPLTKWSDATSKLDRIQWAKAKARTRKQIDAAKRRNVFWADLLPASAT